MHVGGSPVDEQPGHSSDTNWHAPAMSLQVSVHPQDDEQSMSRLVVCVPEHAPFQVMGLYLVR